MSALRKLDHDEVDKIIDFRNSWTRHGVISEQIKRDLHITCDCLLDIANPYKITISSNWLYFYTNNPEDIESLAKTSPMKLLGKISEVEITHAQDAIGLKNPRHLFRTYVHSHRPTQAQRDSLREFLRHNKKYVRTSPSLKDFLSPKSKSLWMMNYFFIDHSDMKMVTALALMNPKLIRKTMPIVKVNS